MDGRTDRRLLELKKFFFGSMMFQEIDKRAVVSGCWDFDLASSTFLIFVFFFLN